jgi:hypothetical protein
MSYSSVEICERSLRLQFVVVLARVQAREPLNTCRQLRAFNILIAASLDFALRPMEAAYNVSGSVHVGFMVDKVALGQVLPRVLQFSPVNFIPPVLHYSEKRKKR